jgi:dipeptidyl aminopeptidase/acylaminoacyl peptidase
MTRTRTRTPSCALAAGLAIAAALAAFAPAPAAAQPAAIELADLFAGAALGSLELSPDGAHLLYTVRTLALAANETETEIWVVPTAGGEPVRLTRNPRPDTEPAWHPDGRTFAFLSVRGGEGGGRTALYRMSPFGGEPERLYGHATAIRAFAWSPDGARIAFTAPEEETEAEKRAKRLGRDVVVEDAPGRRTHLWLLDLAGEKPAARRLTGGDDLTVNGFAWRPDGAVIAFSAAPTPRVADSWRTDVFVVDAAPRAGEATEGAAGDDARPAPRRLTAQPGSHGSPYWTPDGRHIVFHGRLGEYDLGYTRVFRIPAAGLAPGGEPEDITPAAALQPGRYTFTADGRGVFFEALTGTTRGLFFMPLDGRVPVRLTPDAGVLGSATFSRDRERVAFTSAAPDRPEEIVAARVQRGGRTLAGATTLTTHNDALRRLAAGRTEVLRWRGSDGHPVEGLVVYPAGWRPADGPRAMVVKVHGGPAGVFAQGFQGVPGQNAHWWAADGYAVFLPNPRGSTGYGDAVQRMVIEDWGGLDFQDIMTGVDTLVARGVAHPDSLGVMGWSYGGYMTAWTITQTDRFRAAVVGAPITEPIAMWGTQDIRHVFEAYFGGGPYEDGRWEVYQRASPLNHVGNARTPTRLIHGALDERTPPNQAAIFYRALVANGVPAELVWLPRTPHGPREPGLMYERDRLQKEWLDRWIRGAGENGRRDVAAGR